MITLLVWMACVVDPTTGDAIAELSTSDPDIDLSPGTLDFGTVTIGGSSALTVTVQNTGDAALQLVDVAVRAGGDPFSVTAPSMVVIEPGGATTFTVTFSPVATGLLTGELRVQSSDPDEGELIVPLSGEAHGAVLTVTPDPLDLGSVAVGCAGSTPVSFTNTGDVDLVVDSVRIEGAPPEITLDVQGLPWILAPGAAQTGTVHYAPLDNASDGGEIVVESTDNLHPELAVAVTGSGAIGDSAEESFVQGRSEQIDVMVVTSALTDSAKEEALQMLEAYVDDLTDSGIDFHLSVLDTYGCHAGNLDWLSPEEDAGTVADDLERAVNAGVSEYYAAQGLMRAGWAVMNNGAGYYMSCNSGMFRSGAHLHLIGISDGPDESTGSWLSYEEDFFDFKGSEDLFTAHAVAPDDPSGCDRLDAGEGWSDIVDDTGGLFFSFCAADWKDYGHALADLTPGQRAVWELAEEPVPDTIEVAVDHDLQLQGWSWDAASNAVVFDADHVPDPEALIDITYVVAPGTCP